MYWLVSSEVGVEMGTNPDRFKESGFETVKCRAFAVGKNVVDLWGIVPEEVLLVLEVQSVLQKEHMKFFGVGTIKWIGFMKYNFVQEVGLDNCVNSSCKLIGWLETVRLTLVKGLGLCRRHGSR